MKNRKQVYQTHVTQLQKLLDQRSELLKSDSLVGKKRRMDPQFRQIEGHLHQYRRRLKAIEKMEQLVAGKTNA